MKTNDVQIEIEKGKEEKKTKKDKSTSLTQERRPHARGIRILQARKDRGGGVAPRRNNRITESATKASSEAKKAMQEANGKRQDERTKRMKKEQGEHGEH